MKALLKLFITFFKIGAFTFGGGYAMIPLIQKETVEKNQWVTEEDILEIIAIAEATPGPIAINAATFIGHKVKGVWGALAATFGMVLPSFSIIFIISTILREFQHVQAVKYAFFGIRAGVLALILKAMYMMFKKTKKGIIPYIIMFAAFILTAFLKVSVLFVIIGAAFVGLISSFYEQRRQK